MRLLLIITLLGAMACSAMAMNLEEALNAALQNHQQIQVFQANLDRSQEEVRFARSAFLPRVDLDYGYLKQQRDPALLGKESSVLSFSGSINLFNGLSDYHGFKAAEHRAAGADYRLRGVNADIMLATKRAYIEVLRAKRSVATEAEAVKLLERQQRDTRLRYEHGVIARNDLLRVEVQLSSARQNLLRAEGNYQSARRALERVIGVRLPDEEELEENTDPRLLAFDLEQAPAYRQELRESRSELNYLRELVAAAKRERRASKGNYLPDLDLRVAHEKYGDSLTPNGRDRSYDDDNLLLLDASWNLFDGFASSSRVAAADAQVRALAAELRDTEAQLLLQLEVALNEAQIAAGNLEESQIGVTQAEENYRVTENLYKQQRVTTFDLLDAQFLLTSSRNNQVNARYDLYLASAALERILEREPFER